MERRSVARLLALLAALILATAACGSADSDDESSSGDASGDDQSSAGEDVTLSVLIDNAELTVQLTEALTEAYSAEHPNVSFDIEQRPPGGDGDNIVKTRLATGEMSDVFFYNSGSLLQALNPAESLVDLTGDPALDAVAESFLPAVTQEDKVYGVPFGSGMGGGILYNKTVFEENGLSVPTTWDEFAANNQALLDAGVVPVGATYADTWTSQLFVLADYHNVAQAEPTFADDYTANEAKYATTPAALASFERLQQGHDEGWWNEDYAAATFDEGLAMLAAGEVAQYPMLTFALPTIAELSASGGDDIGFFAQPGEDAADNGLTIWLPAGGYIPQTSQHIDVARDFLAFVASVEGADAMTAAATPAGPYLIEGASLPDDVLPAVEDLQAYLDDGNATAALEFLSPVKGPSLEQITVEVGSGLRPAADAAALYDQDVEKQAQQLGLPGW